MYTSSTVNTQLNEGTVISFTPSIRAVERFPILGETLVSCATMDKSVNVFTPQLLL